ncbi:Ser/Thr protein kinase [Eptesipox virus]|uniref:non-specific serine/threonine protein kinase n=1 Tax=Eptesipox virus TaxID=1329402 RepID=A0A220T6L6_9POXV|nr:Ser/Thr protein kinase [Eptesipox virus]ASK51358.1 Ser/Thr protein kinase [Eptesipox virus]WAH71116.1 Ser/Thr protein kinase [Eptesipox virus]
MNKNTELFTNDIIIDTFGTKWKVGPLIGFGGFGCIYYADTNINYDFSKNINNVKYVIKIEPKDSGPLFVEQVFYQRVCKPQIINKWISYNKVCYLGVPRCYGFGFYNKNNRQYRFIVIDCFGCDLFTILQYNNFKLPITTVLRIGIRILNVLKFLHEHGYAHADIKAANIVLDKDDKNKIYLIDYGLSYRFMINNIHVACKQNPKKLHNGTLEFTSLDAHHGVSPSRRGDLEILGYCMINWCGGILPWFNIKKANLVKDLKLNFMKDIVSNMNKIFNNNAPIELVNYMLYIRELEYESNPDYIFLKNILKS